MANVGSLARIALPEILKTIALTEKSGSLEVTSERIVRTVYFDRGFIVFAASSSESDRIGQLLLDEGKITKLQLEHAAQLMHGRRIGEAIVAAGYLTGEELGRALASQARRIATSLFALETAMYRFAEQECPIPLDLRLSLSLYRIQLEGVRAMTNDSLIESNLPPASRTVRLSRCPPFSFEDVSFVPLELLVMEAAQKERSIDAIAERVKKQRPDVLRTIYGLLSAGILEGAGKHAPERRLKVQEESGGFLLSRPEPQKVQAQNVRQEVLLEFENSEGASPQELLNVRAEASPEEVEKAYEEQRSAWDEKQKRVENEKSLCLKVEEIRDRLARAKAQILERASRATPEPEPPPRPVPKKKPATSGDLKRLLQEIKVRKMVEDEEGVISLLYEVVALEPTSAKYEAMLAQALASHPVMQTKAERHFRRALSLEPQNAEIHYLLGRYYQTLGQRARALAEYKTALGIDPELSKARSALVEIKGPSEGSIQDKLKRLFV
jgi:tetratricopeptide (TPR) repeat protein